MPWLLSLLVFFAASVAHAQDRLPVTIESTPPGAEVTVDSPRAKPLGVTPLEGVMLKRGNHVLYFNHDGHEELRLYVDVSQPGQRFNAYLRPLARLHLLSGGSAFEGAQVMIDGEEKGELPVTLSLKSGRHLVQVNKSGYESYSHWLDLSAGEQQELEISLTALEKKGGSLLVSSDVTNATVFLDGKKRGHTPLLLKDVVPGKHQIEIHAEGRRTFSEEVEVKEGQRVSVHPVLEFKNTGAVGEIVVNASVGGATVTVDGQKKGSAPVALRNVSVGKHAVLIEAEGYEDYRTQCVVRKEELCEINARMEANGVSVRVEADVADALLFLDGKRMGTLPFDGHIQEGNHSLEVRSEGYEPFVQQISLSESDSPRLFDVHLVAFDDREDLDVAQRKARISKRRHFGATSYSAVPLPVDQAIMDFSLGWPFLGEFRIGVGIAEHFQAGFAVRSFGRLTEFEGRAKLGVRLAEYLGLAAQLRTGGGLGPNDDATNPTTNETESHSTNTWFAAVEGIASLNFSDRGAFSLWLGLDAYTDRYDFSGRDKDIVLVPSPGRQDQARLRLGGALELAMSRHWNIFALLEGILLGPDSNRRIFGDILNSGESDTEVYFRVGGTYKF